MHNGLPPGAQRMMEWKGQTENIQPGVLPSVSQCSHNHLFTVSVYPTQW